MQSGRSAAVSGALGIAGIVLAVLATGVSQDLVRRRRSLCFG